MKKLMSKIVVALTLLISVSGQIFSGAQENFAKHTLKEMTMVEKCKAKVGACAQSIKSLVWGDGGWQQHYIRRSFAAVVAIVSGMYGMCAFAGEGIGSRAGDLRSQREEVNWNAKYPSFGQPIVEEEQKGLLAQRVESEDDEEGDEKVAVAGRSVRVRRPLMRLLGVRCIEPREGMRDRSQLCGSLFNAWYRAACDGDIQGQLQTFIENQGRENGYETRDLLTNYQLVVVRRYGIRQSGTLHEFLDCLCFNTNFFRYTIGSVYKSQEQGFWNDIWNHTLHPFMSDLFPKKIYI